MARNAGKHIFGSEALAAHGLVWDCAIRDVYRVVISVQILESQE